MLPFLLAMYGVIATLRRQGAMLARIRAAVRTQHSQFVGGHSEEFGDIPLQARPRSADRTPVSSRSLPRTEVFQMSAGDYRLLRSENGQDQSLETGG